MCDYMSILGGYKFSLLSSFIDELKLTAFTFFILLYLLFKCSFTYVPHSIFLFNYIISSFKFLFYVLFYTNIFEYLNSKFYSSFYMFYFVLFFYIVNNCYAIYCSWANFKKALFNFLYLSDTSLDYIAYKNFLSHNSQYSII